MMLDGVHIASMARVTIESLQNLEASSGSLMTNLQSNALSYLLTLHEFASIARGHLTLKGGQDLVKITLFSLSNLQSELSELD
jgi:hypothetical protein